MLSASQVVEGQAQKDLRAFQDQPDREEQQVLAVTQALTALPVLWAIKDPPETPDLLETPERTETQVQMAQTALTALLESLETRDRKGIKDPPAMLVLRDPQAMLVRV
tara:strand:+ start:857 stop:1180 length:324 start_codon:yes stop_codon:yes gene_type:complete